MNDTRKTGETETPSVSATRVDQLVIFQDSIKTLREMIGIQCSSGNWDSNPYMHGMANGMIFAISLFDDKRPEYLEAPELWLEDLPETESLAKESTEI